MYGGVTEYVHRIGRTARIGHQGLATSFYNDRNDDIAQELVNHLLENECTVPEFLQQHVPEDGELDFDDNSEDDEAGDGANGDTNGFGDGSGDDCDLTDLSGQFLGKDIDICREISPGTLDTRHFGLSTESSFSADFVGDASDLCGELAQLIDHGVDGGFEGKDFALAFGLNLLSEVAFGNGGGYLRDVSDLYGEVRSELIDGRCELRPHALDARDLDLTAQHALGSYIARDSADFRGESTKLVDHGVYSLLELENFAFGGPLDFLCEVTVGDGCRDGCNFAH